MMNLFARGGTLSALALALAATLPATPVLAQDGPNARIEARAQARADRQQVRSEVRSGRGEARIERPARKHVPHRKFAQHRLRRPRLAPPPPSAALAAMSRGRQRSLRVPSKSTAGAKGARIVSTAAVKAAPRRLIGAAKCGPTGSNGAAISAAISSTGVDATGQRFALTAARMPVPTASNGAAMSAATG